jgi:hypothetical protein
MDTLRASASADLVSISKEMDLAIKDLQDQLQESKGLHQVRTIRRLSWRCQSPASRQLDPCPHIVCAPAAQRLAHLRPTQPPRTLPFAGGCC